MFLETILSAISAQYPLTQCSAGEFSQLTANGMEFTIRRFHAQGLGHVSVMQAASAAFPMRMDTLILAPTQRDLPLLSYDRVNAMGSDILIFEVYDTQLAPICLPAVQAAKQQAASLPDHNLGSHWYDAIKLPVSLAKKGGPEHTPAFDSLALSYVQAYLTDARSAPLCEDAPKREKTSVYVEGLLQNGGPSTDAFRQTLGPEKTAALFRSVLFATAENPL